MRTKSSISRSRRELRYPRHSEGTLWKVEWEKVNGKFKIHLIDYPEISTTGKAYDDALERLDELIIKCFGDAVPNFEFITPLPDNHPTGGEDFIFVLSAHRSEDLRNSEEIFSEGRCKKCHNYAGHRTNIPLDLAAAPLDDLTLAGPFRIQIISDPLADYLALDSNPDFSRRPILVRGRPLTGFSELHVQHARPFVALRSINGESLFKCNQCGTKVAAYLPHEAPFFEFVAADSLSAPLPPVFAVGESYEGRIAVSGTLRRQLLRVDTFKGLRTRKIGIAQADEVVSIDAALSLRKGS